MKTTSLLLASLGLSLLACRGGGGGGGGDDVNPPDMPPGGQVHIQDVQNDSMPKGTAVSLKGVIVTAIDAFGARTGDLWVEESGGGEFSGVKVFGAPLDQVAQLAPGDIVDITNAEKDEFALSTDTSGRTTTELKGAAGGMLTITKTGTGTVPAAETVDALAIDMLADQAAKDAEWEKWEGVLIGVTNARQLTALTPFGGGAQDQFSFDATGGLTVETVLADLAAVTAVGTCYQSMTGIGDYFFDYLLLPRQSAELVGGGTGCSAEQNATITQLQMGTVTGSVTMKGVFVTARDDIGTSKGVWVADALQGAQFNGVFVFTGANLDAALVVGAKVDVNGTVQEFDVGNPKVGDTVTEVGQATVTLVDGTPGTVVADTSSTAATYGDITNGEPFEGVLVKVTKVKVTNNNLGNNKIEFTDNAGGKIVLDDDLFTTGTFPTFANGDCRDLTGVMHVQLTDNIRTLLARDATDIKTATGCN